jgi:hypothetical protein
MHEHDMTVFTQYITNLPPTCPQKYTIAYKQLQRQVQYTMTILQAQTDMCI